MKHNSFQSFAFAVPDSEVLATARGFLRPSGRQVKLRIRVDRQARRARILNNALPKTEASDINQKQFDRLLGWLDPDREMAGVAYERIRKRLIKIFASRGSHIPEDLADKTFNRVARKLPEIQDTYVGDPAYYFASVAGFIFLEELKKEKVPAARMPEPASRAENEEIDQAILEKCVAKLPADDRDLLLAYYQYEKQAKIEHRKKLAEQFGVGMNALRIRAYRIRFRLQERMEGRRSTGY